MVLFFDEFQHVGEVVKNDAIEAVIREVAQEPGNLVFLFSGSNRHLLQKLFDDKNKPFYKLCNKIHLQRISETDYCKHIFKIAKLTNKHQIDQGVVDVVFDCTERHTYYMNLLCDRIWRLSNVTVTITAQEWDKYAQEERSQVSAEIENLSANQRKLLIVLSRIGATNSPRSDEFISLCKMPGYSVTQSLKIQLQKDYVELSFGYYRVMDPLIRYVLSQ